MTPLVKRLLEESLATEQAVNKAVLMATNRGGTIPLNLIRSNILDEDLLLEFIQREFDVPAVLQFEMEDLQGAVLGAIPRRLAETYRAIPVHKQGATLEVILSDPTDTRGIREVASASGLKVKPRIATESVISWALLKYYEVITPTHAPDEDKKPTRPEQESLPSVMVDQSTSKQKEALPEDGERISFTVVKEEVDEKDGPEMGNWDAPIELQRTLAEGEEEPPPSPARQMKTTRREIPLEDIIEKPLDKLGEAEDKLDKTVRAVPEEEPPEEPLDKLGEAGDKLGEAGEGIEVDEDMEDAPLLLVDEDDWQEAGQALEDAIEEDAVTLEGPIIDDQPTPVSPIMVTRNVILGQKADKEIIPPQPMTKRRAVSGIVPHEDAEKSEQKPTQPETPDKKAKKIELQALPKMKKRGKLDPAALAAWQKRVLNLESRDAVLNAALALLDKEFGPAVFLARKGKGLGGWNCSRSFEESLPGTVHDILVEPPAPREVWHSLERKRGMMGPIAVQEEYPFLDPLLGGRKATILVLPVVIREIAAGAFVCVLREVWTSSPELRDTLETFGEVLSEKLEDILKKKKKKKKQG